MSPQLLPKHPSFCLLSLLHATGLSRPLFHTRMEPNTCAACNAPFRGGDAVISVLGRRYHSACFACDFCHQPLANGPCPPQHPMLLPQSPPQLCSPAQGLTWRALGDRCAARATSASLARTAPSATSPSRARASSRVPGSASTHRTLCAAAVVRLSRLALSSAATSTSAPAAAASADVFPTLGSSDHSQMSQSMKTTNEKQEKTRRSGCLQPGQTHANCCWWAARCLTAYCAASRACRWRSSG